jgi:hypothetical protein
MTVKIKMTGLDEFRKKIDRLSQNARAIHGKNEVPFTELYPDSFVSRTTDFHSLQEMFDASGIDGAEDLKGEVWDNFVATRSRFSGWTEMSKAAMGEWVKRKLHQ